MTSPAWQRLLDFTMEHPPSACLYTRTRILVSLVCKGHEAAERRAGSGANQNVAAVGPDGFKLPAPINTGRSGLGAARPPAVVIGDGQWPAGAVPDTPMSPSDTPRSRTARQSTQVSGSLASATYHWVLSEV